MKTIKVYFILVLVFNSFMVFGQKTFSDDINLVTESELEYSWNNTNLDWVLVNNSLYSYDTSGLLKDVIKSDIGTGIPVSKVMYFYNENGLMSAYEVYSWSSGVWRETNRYNYRYEDGKRVDQIIQAWSNNTWTNLTNDSSYLYNEDGLLIQTTNYVWRNGKWIKQFEKYYDYNQNSLLSSVTSIDLYGKFLSRVNYSYNSFNKLSEMYAEFWRNNQWENSWNRIYVYDNCGYIKSLDRQSWVNGTWMNTGRSVFTLSLNPVSYTGKKVPVCHNGNTLYISINALEAHLKHGDCIGECTADRNNDKTGSDEKNKHEKPPFTIYPNPAKEKVTIKFDRDEGKESKRVELIDFYGKLIKSFNTKDNCDLTIYRENLHSGKYYLRLAGKEVYSVVVIFE